MADLNSVDEEKCTPLLLAAAQGCFQVVSLLLERGADVTCKDNSGRTPLHWAVGQDKTIERLLKVEQVFVLLCLVITVTVKSVRKPCRLPFMKISSWFAYVILNCCH